MVVQHSDKEKWLEIQGHPKEIESVCDTETMSQTEKKKLLLLSHTRTHTKSTFVIVFFIANIALSYYLLHSGIDF